jgi:hypothetical protein
MRKIVLPLAVILAGTIAAGEPAPVTLASVADAGCRRIVASCHIGRA